MAGLARRGDDCVVARKRGLNMLEIGATGSCRTVSLFLFVILRDDVAGVARGEKRRRRRKRKRKRKVFPLLNNVVALKFFADLMVVVHCHCHCGGRRLGIVAVAV